MPANIAGREWSNADLAIAIGAVVALISVFLPWWSITYNLGLGAYSSSDNGFTSWGVLFLLADIVVLVLFGLRNFAPEILPKTLPFEEWQIVLTLGAVMIVSALLYWLAGGSTITTGPGYSSGVSIGLYLGLIAAIAVAVGGWMKKAPLSAAPPTAPTV